MCRAGRSHSYLVTLSSHTVTSVSESNQVSVHKMRIAHGVVVGISWDNACVVRWFVKIVSYLFSSWCYKRMLENDWKLPLMVLAQDLGLSSPQSIIKGPFVPQHLCLLRYFSLHTVEKGQRLLWLVE